MDMNQLFYKVKIVAKFSDYFEDIKRYRFFFYKVVRSQLRAANQVHPNHCLQPTWRPSGGKKKKQN